MRTIMTACEVLRLWSFTPVKFYACEVLCLWNFTPVKFYACEVLRMWSFTPVKFYACEETACEVLRIVWAPYFMFFLLIAREKF